MKNLKTKLVALGILATIVISSTPAFAVTNTSITTKPIAVSSPNGVSSLPNTITPSFNYGPMGGPHAYEIVDSGGVIKIGDVGLAVREIQAH